MVYYTRQLLAFSLREGSRTAESTDSPGGYTAATMLGNTETTPCSATRLETQDCTLEESLCQLAAEIPKAETEKKNYLVVLFLKKSLQQGCKGRTCEHFDVSEDYHYNLKQERHRPCNSQTTLKTSIFFLQEKNFNLLDFT